MEVTTRDGWTLFKFYQSSSFEDDEDDEDEEDTVLLGVYSSIQGLKMDIPRILTDATENIRNSYDGNNVRWVFEDKRLDEIRWILKREGTRLEWGFLAQKTLLISHHF